MAWIEHHPARAVTIIRGLRISVLGLLLAVAARAQTVQGIVTDGRTGRLLSGARVRLLAPGDSLAGQAQSGAEGRYWLRTSAAGRYRLRFEFPGYRAGLSGAIELRSGQTLALDFSLTPLTRFDLDTVVVYGEPVPRYLADFYQRRRMGFGSFLTRQDIERYWPQKMTDLVPRISGFELRYLVTGEILIRTKRRGFGGGGCPPVVFVDGARVGNTDTYDVNSFLWTETIAAIEAYDGPGKLPAEFNTTGSGCGVLAFWTQR